jgi:hypothetical protein
MIKHIVNGVWILALVFAPARAVVNAQGPAPAAASSAPLSAQNTPFKTVATIQQLMLAVLEPTSNTVFHVEAEAPQDTRGWNAVANAALALAEAGNLLMLPGRAKDSGDWMKHVQALMDTAVKARKAAEAQNADQVVAAGYEINDVCRDCHVQYKPRRLPPPPAN